MTHTTATAADGGRVDPRVGCSTISFRRLALSDALRAIREAGFAEVDLGALPGVCDHVPTPLLDAQVDAVATSVADSGLLVRAVNAEVGDMDDPDLDRAELASRLRTLVDLCAAVGTRTVILPNGRQGTTPRTDLCSDIAAAARSLTVAAELLAASGLELLVEAPHARRLVCDLDRTEMLFAALGQAPVGAVLDVSHVVASGGEVGDAVRRFGSRVRHVHLRDAVLGDLNRSIGRGAVDFPGAVEALARSGYQGHYSLELETHDIPDDERPAEAARAGRYITSLIGASAAH